MGLRDWDALGTSLWKIRRSVLQTVAEVIGGRGARRRITPSFEEAAAELVFPPEVEPPTRDFDVNEFFRSSPNLVVATVLGSKRSPEGSSPPKVSSHELPVSELRGRFT